MASRSPEATAPAGSGASPGGLGTAPRACVASHVPPVAITNPPVIFRMSRRDGIAPPKGQTTFSVARAEPNTRIRKRGLTPETRLLPMAVVHCKAASLSSSLSSTRNRSPTDEDPMYLPPTVSAALAVSGLNPLEAKLLLGRVLDR